MKVALFATCLGDQFFADACADSVRLLRHVGAEVSFPEGQTCCGQPAYNSGHRSEAVRLMEHTVDVFSGADYVVLPSGSCAGMLRMVYPGLATLDSLRVATEALAGRTYELSEFLVEVAGVDRLGDGLKGFRIAYHHGCHALRELGVMSEPLSLLRGAGDGGQVGFSESQQAALLQRLLSKSLKYFLQIQHKISHTALYHAG